MDNLLNNYNNTKQLLDEQERKFNRWKKENGWDTKTYKQRREAKLIDGKQGRDRKVKEIKNTRAALLGCMQGLIKSSKFDDDTKEAVDQAAQTLTSFENNNPKKALKQLIGPRKLFEDKPTYQKRKDYEALTDGSKNSNHGKRYAAEYMQGVASNALKLVTDKLKPTNRNKAILEFFQKRLEDTATEAKERKDKVDENNTAQNLKTSLEKRDLDDEEEAREYLKWMVLIEHEGEGDRKLVRCNVTGDQLTLTNIDLGSDGDVCKKRKRP